MTEEATEPVSTDNSEGTTEAPDLLGVTQEQPAPEQPAQDSELSNEPPPLPGDEPERSDSLEADGEDPYAVLPEKFKTVSDLAKSYQELERKLTETTAAQKPPETYQLELPDGQELTEEDQQTLKEMGLTNDQAQKMVDFLQESIVPQVQQAQAKYQMAQLASDWGMHPESQTFNERMMKVKQWAQKNLPGAAVQEMAKSAHGVNAIYQMMQANFAANSTQGNQAQQRPNRAQLEKLMDDPRYRVDNDYTEWVRQQFVNAYD